MGSPQLSLTCISPLSSQDSSFSLPSLAEEELDLDSFPIVEDTVIHSVVVESCSGWRLNKLPEVKAFITKDLETLYERSEFKKIPGKSPEAVFLNIGGEEVERVVLTGMTRDLLNSLMVSRGIPLKSSNSVTESVRDEI